MYVRSALFSVYISAILVSPSALAQNSDIQAMARIIVGDGPYEIKGESGVFGFVVASTAAMVTFKPCVGSSFEVEKNKLVKTNFKCKDSPSSDEHPLVASCNNTDKYWDDAAATMMAHQNDLPIGTTFYEKDKSSDTMAMVVVGTEKMAGVIDSVKELKDCGKFTVGFDNSGKAVVHVIGTMQAVKLLEQK